MIDLVSWDGLLALGELLTLAGPLIILGNRAAYVPRWSSGSLVVALGMVAVALFGLGAPIGAVVTAAVTGVWAAVFALRGARRG